MCAGYFPDYLRYLARTIGVHYGRPLRVEWLFYTTGSACLHAVLDGEADMTDIYFLQSTADDDSLKNLSKPPPTAPTPTATTAAAATAATATAAVASPAAADAANAAASSASPDGAAAAAGGASQGQPSLEDLLETTPPVLMNSRIAAADKGLMGAYFYRTCPIVGSSAVFVTRKELNLKTFRDIVVYLRSHPLDMKQPVAFLTSANQRQLAFLLPSSTPYIVLSSKQFTIRV